MWLTDQDRYSVDKWINIKITSQYESSHVVNTAKYVLNVNQRFPSTGPWTTCGPQELKHGPRNNISPQNFSDRSPVVWNNILSIHITYNFNVKMCVKLCFFYCHSFLFYLTSWSPLATNNSKWSLVKKRLETSDLVWHSDGCGLVTPPWNEAFGNNCQQTKYLLVFWNTFCRFWWNFLIFVKSNVRETSESHHKGFFLPFWYGTLKREIAAIRL